MRLLTVASQDFFFKFLRTQILFKKLENLDLVVGTSFHTYLSIDPQLKDSVMRNTGKQAMYFPISIINVCKISILQ